MTEHGRTYDVVVIGAGSTGENAADYAIKNGLSAVVVEKELVGGECSYWACMPSKALLRPTEVIAAVERIPAAAAALEGGVDVDKVLKLRDSFAANWDDKYQVQWLDDTGIDLVRGIGRLSGEREVTVEHEDGSTTVLTANRAVVIATGSVAAIPPIDGLKDVDPWDNRDATTAKEVPERLLVLGGGVVGVEMAQAWKRLGSGEVTIVEMQDRLLPTHEPFVGDELREALESEDIRVLTDAKLVAASREGSDGPVTGRLEDGTELEADEILVAVGRRAVSRDLGLETVGLEPDGSLEVDGHLRVKGVEDGWLYAAGDVNGRSLLTHMGKYQARLIGGHIADPDTDEAWADDTATPAVVFTDPQVASVGLTEAQARERYDDVTTVRHDVGDVAGGALMGKGFSGPAQLVIDADRQVIVGATFVGPGIGELLHAATIAIVSEITMDRLWHAVPAYPTVSEVWLRLQEQWREKMQGS
ncbi:MAG: NAD(P)/FAD-dependent oxidoreductase [Nitriliruptorales bacterium]|nr:NAD(P)/FAD-dependent oxidoreductase [Nitriliruptorales bacterium]